MPGGRSGASTTSIPSGSPKCLTCTTRLRGWVLGWSVIAGIVSTCRWAKPKHAVGLACLISPWGRAHNAPSRALILPSHIETGEPMADPKRGKVGQAKSGSKRSAAGNPAGMPATGTPADPKSHTIAAPRRGTLAPARTRLHPPANVQDESSRYRSRARPRGLLGQAGRRARLVREVDKVLEWNAPDAKWFVGGKLNASYNCVDRHIKGPRRNKAALIWVGEPGDRRPTPTGISTGR